MREGEKKNNQSKQNKQKNQTTHKYKKQGCFDCYEIFACRPWLQIHAIYGYIYHFKYRTNLRKPKSLGGVERLTLQDKDLKYSLLC